MVKELVNSLSDAKIRQQAINIIQSMIEKIVVTPEVDGFSIDLHGELGRILEIVGEKESPSPDLQGKSSLSVVAGVGFEPTTFRL